MPQVEVSPTLRDGVVAVIVDAPRVLAIRRGRTVPFPDYWSLPSGKFEAGEAAQEVLVREVEEELGLYVEPLRRVWESTSDDGQYRLHWWAARIVGGTLTPSPREVAEARWVTPDRFDHFERTFESDRRFFREVWPTVAEPF